MRIIDRPIWFVLILMRDIGRPIFGTFYIGTECLISVLMRIIDRPIYIDSDHLSSDLVVLHRFRCGALIARFVVWFGIRWRVMLIARFSSFRIDYDVIDRCIATNHT